MQWFSEFYERVGQGVYVYYFESGNPQSEAAARSAAEQQSRRNVILWPVLNGQKQPPPIEFISPNVAGAEHLLSIVTDYWDKACERYIVGQTASSRSDTSGMGTHDTAMQADTKHQLIKMDAEILDDVMTEDVVAPIQARNFPNANFFIRHVSNVDKPDSDKKLDAAKKMFDMKIPLKSQEVREVGGFSKPGEGEETVEAPAEPMGLPGQPPKNGQGTSPSPNGEFVSKPTDGTIGTRRQNPPMQPKKFRRELPPPAGASERQMARYHERQVGRHLERAEKFGWKAVINQSGSVPLAEVADDPVHREFQQARHLEPAELASWALGKAASSGEPVSRFYRKMSEAARKAHEHKRESVKFRKAIVNQSPPRDPSLASLGMDAKLYHTRGIGNTPIIGTTGQVIPPVSPEKPTESNGSADGRDLAEKLAADWNKREAEGGGVTQSDLIDAGARLINYPWRLIYKDRWIVIPFDVWLGDPQRAAKSGSKTRYAHEPLPEGGTWLTIGATNGSGGSHVYVVDGKVAVGHSSLRGKPLHALASEKSKEYGERAKQAGVHPEHAHQLAGEMMSHDRAFKAGHKAMLGEAKKMSTALGHEDLSGLGRRAQQGNLDASKIKGFDDVAARMAEAYPEHFPNKDTATDDLYQMLTEGEREGMTVDEAYEAAIEHLASNVEHEEQYGDEAVNGYLEAFNDPRAGRLPPKMRPWPTESLKRMALTSASSPRKTASGRQ